MKIICVIPAFNEAGAIADVIAGVRALANVDPLVVDDASTDETADMARRAGADVLNLNSNRGYEGALDAGFAEAAKRQADIVATLDADGQIDPALLGLGLRKLSSSSADLVIGIRSERARFGERLFGWYGRLRFGVPDLLCGLKIYRLSLYQAHGRFDGTKMIGAELAVAALKHGAKAVTIDVPVKPRADGVSRFGQGFRVNRRIIGALWRAIRLRPGGDQGPNR